MLANRRLLFITLSNIGDLVMTTPLLEALHLSYPNHLIDIVADARSSELLLPCPYLGRLLIKDKGAGIPGTYDLIVKLREQAYDAAVDLRSAILTLFIRSGQRGIKRRGTSAGTHAVQHHFTALRSIIGPNTEIPDARLWLDEQGRAKAKEILSGLPHGRRLVVAPGANWPGKIWPVERYAGLLQQISNDFDSVIVVGSKEDISLGEQLCSLSPLPTLNTAGTTSLLEAAACLSGSTAFVGNDSGLGHIAAALSVPTVTVFGPGQPDRYRPWGSRAAVVLAPNQDLSALPAEAVAKSLLSHLAGISGNVTAVGAEQNS
ncbi:MAG: heptosyltransferase-3 [Gammaproteobacteria bacterium]|jgi:heptosyltransferase-3